MKKKNNTNIIISLVISVILIIIAFKIILDSTGKVNKGDFRIQDFVVTSQINVEDQLEDEINSLSNISFNLSNSNNIRIQIAKNQGTLAKEIYIDNLTCELPSIVTDEFSIKLGDNEKIDLLPLEKTLNQGKRQVKLNDKYNISIVEEDNVYVVNILINNLNFVKAAKINDSTESITYDGKLLDKINFDLANITFNASFNINIIDNNSKKNTVSCSVSMPNNELKEAGISISRIDFSTMLFKVENNINFYNI